MLRWGRGDRGERVIGVEELLRLCRGPDTGAQVHVDIRFSGFSVGGKIGKAAEGDITADPVVEQVCEHGCGAGIASVGVELVIAGVFPLVQVAACSVQEFEAIEVVIVDGPFYPIRVCPVA